MDHRSRDTGHETRGANHRSTSSGQASDESRATNVWTMRLRDEGVERRARSMVYPVTTCDSQVALTFTGVVSSEGRS